MSSITCRCGQSNGSWASTGPPSGVIWRPEVLQDGSSGWRPIRRHRIPWQRNGVTFSLNTYPDIFPDLRQPAGTKAPLHWPHGVTPRVPEGPGAQPNRRVPTGAFPASGHCGRDLRVPGSFGMGQSRLRGLWKVDCDGYMAALGHNVKKMVRRLGRGGSGRPVQWRPRTPLLRAQGTLRTMRWAISSRRCGALPG